MPEAALKFTLPEEQKEFALAAKGADYAFALRETHRFVRDRIKHGHTYADADAALDAVFNAIVATANERGLEL